MGKYEDSIGNGGIWVREGKKGKYLSWTIELIKDYVPITIHGVAFKNEKREGNQPYYRMIVNGWEPTKPREKKMGAKDEDVH